MPVPKKRTSRMKRGSRRSHDGLVATMQSVCSECGEAKLSHRVCPKCGFYKNIAILPIDEG
ncbi:MAG: 50S ribosomal protein L32 [Nitrospinota bacterium]